MCVCLLRKKGRKNNAKIEKNEKERERSECVCNAGDELQIIEKFLFVRLFP